MFVNVIWYFSRGFNNNASFPPVKRCYPHTPATCNCKELQLSSTGPSSLAQSDKMGKYHLFGYYNRKPAYQHESGLDYLFYAEGEAWVIGAMFGGARVGIVNFDKHPCPYQLKSLWRHSGNYTVSSFASDSYCSMNLPTSSIIGNLLSYFIQKSKL